MKKSIGFITKITIVVLIITLITLIIQLTLKAENVSLFWQNTKVDKSVEQKQPFLVNKKSYNYNKNKKKSDISPLELFQGVAKITKDYYVEEKDMKSLVEYALNGMLSELDPHSRYLNTDEYTEMNINTSGEFGGVGIEITLEEGIVKVISPIDGTPADKVGIKSGDYITHVDGESVIGSKLSKVVKKIRGKIGTKIELTVIRKENKKPLIFNLTRSIIEIIPVKSSVKLNDIGYFKITSFSQKTTAEFKKHYAKIEKKIGKENMKGLILDLRNNPGGLLDESVSIADIFLDKDLIVVSTKGRVKKNNITLKTKEVDQTNGLPIVVLINEGTASASEIVSGALQDHKRAIIVGLKSFGKGSVQSIVPLVNNGAVKLTISRYYTPLGKSIQSKGINPDITVSQVQLPEKENTVKRNNLIGESKLAGHLKNTDVQNDELLKIQKKHQTELNEIYHKDYQLGRALDILKVIIKLKNT